MRISSSLNVTTFAFFLTIQAASPFGQSDTQDRELEKVVLLHRKLIRCEKYDDARKSFDELVKRMKLPEIRSQRKYLSSKFPEIREAWCLANQAFFNFDIELWAETFEASPVSMHASLFGILYGWKRTDSEVLRISILALNERGSRSYKNRFAAVDVLSRIRPANSNQLSTIVDCLSVYAVKDKSEEIRSRAFSAAVHTAQTFRSIGGSL